MSITEPGKVTKEEHEFIASLNMPQALHDDCVQCGRQISSARQVELPDTDVCDACDNQERRI